MTLYPLAGRAIDAGIRREELLHRVRNQLHHRSTGGMVEIDRVPTGRPAEPVSPCRRDPANLRDLNSSWEISHHGKAPSRGPQVPIDPRPAVCRHNRTLAGPLGLDM